MRIAVAPFAALVVVVVAAALGVGACAPMSGMTCESNNDCPGSVCADHVCTSASDDAPSDAPAVASSLPVLRPGLPHFANVPSSSSSTPTPPPPLELALVPGSDGLRPGTAPRVLVHGDGVVDVFYALDGCSAGGLVRWRPMDGSRLVIADATTCVSDFDAKRDDATGRTHLVVHAHRDDLNEVVRVFDIDDDGALVSQIADTSPNLLTDDYRGDFPRIALRHDGGAVPAWSRIKAEPDQNPNEVEQGAPASIAYYAEKQAQGLALAFDDADVEFLAYTDRGVDPVGDPIDIVRLWRSDASSTALALAKGDGALDAVACAGKLLIAHRKGDTLGVDDARHAGTLADPYTNSLVANGFDAARNAGDVAIACGAGAPDVAHVTGGVVHVWREDGPNTWHDVIVPVAASGGVSVAVTPSGLLRVATGTSDGHVQFLYN